MPTTVQMVTVDIDIEAFKLEVPNIGDLVVMREPFGTTDFINTSYVFLGSTYPLDINMSSFDIKIDHFMGPNGHATISSLVSDEYSVSVPRKYYIMSYFSDSEDCEEGKGNEI